MGSAVIAIGTALTATTTPTFTVAGVHLLDTPAKARAVLLATGYKVERVSPSDSYAQRLASARAMALRIPPPKTRSTNIGAITATQGDQRITIVFDDDAAGARIVSAVNYIGADLAHPYGRALASLVNRHGDPTRLRPQSATWCVGDGGCEAGSTPDTDMLSVRAESELNGRNITHIRLEVGDITKRTWNAAHRADLRRITQANDGF